MSVIEEEDLKSETLCFVRPVVEINTLTYLKAMKTIGLTNQKSKKKKDEKSRKKLNQIFPDAKFTIDVDYLPRLNYLFTSKKKLFIRAIPTNYTFEVIGDKITYKYIFNELIKQKFTPKTDFNFFSHFRKMDDDMFDMIFV